MTLVGTQVAFGRKPRRLKVFGILEQRRPDGTAPDALSVEVAPKPQQRVVAPDVRATADTVCP